MAEKIGSMVVELRAETKQIRRELKDMRSHFSGMEKDINKSSASIKNFATTLGVTAIAGTALYAAKNFIASSVEIATQNELLQNSFNNLTSSVGVVSDELMTKLKSATHGAVSDMKIMQQANQALLLGIDPEALPLMFEGARAAAQATGRTVTEAISDITLGIGRQSKMILDNLGIIVDANEAYKRYAGEIGKASTELTELEKKQAFTSAAMDALSKNAEKINPLLSTQAEEAQKLSAEWTNMKNEVGQELLPVLKDLTGELLDQKDAIRGTAVAVGEFLAWTLKGAGMTAEFVVSLFEGKDALALTTGELAYQLVYGHKYIDTTEDMATSSLTLADAAKSVYEAFKKQGGTYQEFIEMYPQFINYVEEEIELQNELTETIKETTEAVVDLRKEFRKGFGRTSMGKDYGDVYNEIASGQADASQEVKDLFGIKQLGGEIHKTGPYLLHEGEYVVPASKASGGASGGHTIIISGDNYGIDAEEIAEKLQELILRKVTI